ncbi:MAG: hypothetical protein R3C61_17515 [Bacteroidia bacterium]
MKRMYPHLPLAALLIAICGVAGCFFSGKNPVVDPFPDILSLAVKDPAIADYFAVSPEGIFMYESAENKKAGQPEAVIYPDEYDRFVRLVYELPADSLLALYLAKASTHWPVDDDEPQAILPTDFISSGDSLLPLKGLRVALDPGHIAGDYETAVTEGKYIHLMPTPATYMQPVRFFEAGLTLATAWAVREELEALGATVFMTRTQPGKGALGLTFPEWKQTRWDSLMEAEKTEGTLTEAEIAKWKTRAEDKDIMSRFFTPEDLRERARKINAFHPHLTLIIHYNIDSPNWDQRDAAGRMSPTGQNYCMAFVPGAFMTGELARPEDRLAFLRLLLTRDLRQSVTLSDAFVRHSVAETGVPVVSPDYPLRYLQKASLPAGYPGVYARNLSLTRMVTGPVCYGESLCQDNIQESRSLSLNDTEIAGNPAPKRVKSVARAYVKAVKEYVEKEFTGKSSADHK